MKPRSLASDLCWLLSRASHGLTTEMTAALEELWGLAARPRRALTAMCGEHTQTEIARLVGLDKTTMVVTVDELEAAGLAERRPSSTDRRARVIAVTDAGKRKVAPGRQGARPGARGRARACSQPDEREVFLGALGRLACGRLAEPVPARSRCAGAADRAKAL